MKILVIDYTLLNDVTKNDHFPLKDASLILYRLKDSRIFSKIDLKSGYYHLMVHPDSRFATFFVVPSGQYEFKRLPQD